MALHERSNNAGTFLNVKHGGLVLESKEPREGYEPVEVTNLSTNEQMTKYIKKFASVDGRITKLEWYDREDNGVKYMGLKIHLRDGSEFYQLDLPFGKRHFDYFTKVMENIDYSEPVEFVAWPDKQDKRQTAFAAKQFDRFVEWRYTKDNMGDCPQAKQDVMGKWDFRDQKIWLYKKLIEKVIPHVESLNAFDEPQPEYTEDESPIKKAALAATAATEAARKPVPADLDDIPF